MAHLLVVFGIVLSIVVGNSLIIALLARTCGQPWRDAIASGLCLAQVGEFSFLLAIIAHSDAVGTPLIKEKTFHAMVSATILTLLCTPYLVGAAPWVGARCERLMMRWRHLLRPAGRTPIDHRATAPEEVSLDSSADSALIVIVGFGPAGHGGA